MAYLHKSSKPCVQILHLVKAAGVKVAELGEKVKAALEVHETARVAARVRRRQPQAPAAASRNVAQQGSASVAGSLLQAGRLCRCVRHQIWQELLRTCYPNIAVFHGAQRAVCLH